MTVGQHNWEPRDGAGGMPRRGRGGVDGGDWQVAVTRSIDENLKQKLKVVAVS